MKRLLLNAWRSFIGRPHLPMIMYLAVIGWRLLLNSSLAGVDLAPYWFVLMWTASFALGGSMASVGALVQATRLESSGLALLAWGSATYGVVFGYLLWPDWTQALVAIAITAMCLIRMRVLAQDRKAQKLARKLED